MRKIAYVLLRVMAIWFFLYLTIPSIWGSIYYLYLSKVQFPTDSNKIVLYLSSQGIVYLILSIVLWFYAEKISMIIYKNESEVEPTSDKGKTLDLALAIIGVYLIVSNIPGLISNIYSVISIKFSPYSKNSDNIKNIIQTSTGIIIGIICINRKINIVGLIKKLIMEDTKDAL